MEYPELSSLGSAKTAYRYERPSSEILEVFPNPRLGSSFVIGLDCLEFTSLCPITGQPDYGRIYVHYVPEAYCVESKSMKLYLGAYRNHGAFHEDCVNQVTEDLESRLRPLYIRVFGDFRPRGGIAIRPMVERFAARCEGDLRADIRAAIASYDSLVGALK